MALRDPHRPGRLALAGTLVLAGSLGAWPGPAGASDPVVALAWIATLAPAAGALAVAHGLALVPLGWLVPALWCLPVLLGSPPPRALPSPGLAALAWTGLYALGGALGALARWRSWNAWATSGLVLLAAGTLSLLPARAAWAAEPWPPRVTSALLDASPCALVLESAGVDWMRHAALYDPAGTDRFARRPYGGPLAGAALLLVGWALAAAAQRARPRAGRAATRDDR